MEKDFKKDNSSESHVCNTCIKEIVDISRILIMRDKDLGPHLMFFHFFYPCWDWELLCQQFPNLKIDQVGFSFPESMDMSEDSIQKLKSRLELWA